MKILAFIVKVLSVEVRLERQEEEAIQEDQ